MKLASIKAGGRDGTLVVVSRDLKRAVTVASIAPTLQLALDQWDSAAPRLNAVYASLNERTDPAPPWSPESAHGAVFAFDLAPLAAPLPRCFEFLDGSAYLPHVERVRRARNAEVPASFYTDPLMYQATSATFLGPNDSIVAASEEQGIDMEAEVLVVTDDVPMGVSDADAADHIQLIGLVNDVSLRNLIPGELAKGFGFVQSKPRSALSPVLVTPDELGENWRDCKVHLPLITHLNKELFGAPEAGVDMQFNFAQLVAHAAKTRSLSAGTLVGSGTVANQDESKGASCLAEKRMLEIIATGSATTPFMSFGDWVRIEMFDQDGKTIFGAIEQQVVAQ